MFQDFNGNVNYKNAMRKTNNVIKKVNSPFTGLTFMVDGRKKKTRAHESVKLNICVSQIVHD